jgi:DNA modification methylase
MTKVTIHQGHVLDRLREIPEESVHCVITSPPYWGLRDYGIEPVVWGGREGCQHEWGEENKIPCGNAPSSKSTLTTNSGKGPKAGDKFHYLNASEASQGKFCRLCGAWRGCLGLEPTIDLYVQHTVEIFREVRRVLRADGVCFVNLGDSYSSLGACKGGEIGTYKDKKGNKRTYIRSDYTKNRGTFKSGWSDAPLSKRDIGMKNGRYTEKGGLGLKPKDLCGVPWRVALALQADGYWLRSDTIWNKPNPMPESVNGWRWEPHQVRDADGEMVNCPGCAKCADNDGLVLRKGAGRPTRSHEYIFILTKSATGFWDTEAVRENGVIPAGTMAAKGSIERSSIPGVNSRPPEYKEYSGTRNLRSVWTIATQSFPGAHFATFPEKLVEKCLKAGTSEKGVCPSCKAPWVRVVERTPGKSKPCPKEQAAHAARGGIGLHTGTVGKSGSSRIDGETRTLGFRPSCTCRFMHPVYELDEFQMELSTYSPLPPVPATVIDIFGGSGTVGLVAAKMGRNAILIEAKPEYCTMAAKRIKATMGMMAKVDIEEAQDGG